MNVGSITMHDGLATRSGLHRTVFEFLVTGGMTLVLLPIAYFYRTQAGLEDSEYFVSFAAFYAAYVINDPHFSVSYLLFYKNARSRFFGPEFRGAQQVRYIVAGLLVPLILIAWIGVAMVMQSAQLLGSMVQLMYLLVGWHYVKQGFGVLAVLSARRGIQLSRLERRVLLAHCFSGWAYAWASPTETGRDYEESGIVYTALAHPPGLERVTLVFFIASTIALLYVIVRRITAKMPFPPWAASCGYVMSIWLWTIFSQMDPLMIYVIPALHSLQYWYFVYLLKRNETKQLYHQEASNGLDTSMAPALDHDALHRDGFRNDGGTFARYATRRLGLFFVTAVGLAWLFFHGIPDVLDQTLVASTASMGIEPDVSARGLGTTPYLAAFSTFINIHHYFIDHVIWRRENPDTRFLKNVDHPSTEARRVPQFSSG